MVVVTAVAAFITSTPVRQKHGLKNKRWIRFDAFLQYIKNKLRSCFSLESVLKTHVKTKHEGVKLPCSHCEYAATRANALKKHINRKHKGVKYPRFHCDFTATRAKQQNQENPRH